VARALAGQGHKVIESDIGPDDLSALDRGGFDVVFPVLHGTFGEDGQLQEILERRRIPYVGSDAASSRLAMDKQRAKEAFARAGLLTAQGRLLVAGAPSPSRGAEIEVEIGAALDQVQFPCVVKPNCQGSSIGVVIATSEGQARQAIAESLRNYGDCLVEQFIKGRELTVGILAGQALPVLEVRPADGFYDYQAKYQADTTEYLFDMGLSPAQLQAIQTDAVRAFAALGCRDFGRVDIILDDTGRRYLLEVNTIPGFTDHSLLPKAAARVGITMAQMCSQIVRMAYERPI
jgi:D-alanine-D-alanine ligase